MGWKAVTGGGKARLASAPLSSTPLQWVLGSDSGGSSVMQPLHPLSGSGKLGSHPTPEQPTPAEREQRQSPPTTIVRNPSCVSVYPERRQTTKDRIMAPISDDEWADLAAHELPKTSDPVVQKYLESRRALMAEEQKHRSGITLSHTARTIFQEPLSSPQWDPSVRTPTS